MKKICRKIKLHKYCSHIDDEFRKEISGREFYVLFDDGSYEYCITKSEVYRLLKNDHIKPIRYIFDSTDRIIVDRDVLIDTES